MIWLTWLSYNRRLEGGQFQISLLLVYMFGTALLRSLVYYFFFELGVLLREKYSVYVNTLGVGCNFLCTHFHTHCWVPYVGMDEEEWTEYLITAYSGIYDINYCAMIWDACLNLLWRDTSYVCTLVSVYKVSPVSLGMGCRRGHMHSILSTGDFQCL